MTHKPLNDLAREVWQSLPNPTYAGLAKALNERYGMDFTESQIRHRLLRAGVDLYAEFRNQLPRSKDRLFNAPLLLPHQRSLVIGDLHCPYQHNEFLERALDLSHAFGISRIIVAGDLLDAASISRHPKWVEASLEEELDSVGAVLRVLTDVAPVTYLNGNHDERVSLSLNTQFRLESLVGAALKQAQTANPITTTDYDYLYVGEDWIIGHMSEYSRNPGVAASRIASRRRYNVVTGHDHLIGYNSIDGFLGVSLGCVSKASSFWYRERRLNSMPDWDLGFALMSEDGDFYLFDESGNTSLNGTCRPFSYWNDRFTRKGV